MTAPRDLETRRFAVAVAAGYAVLAVAILGPRLLIDRTLFERDISTVWLPMADTLARIVADGDAPLWDPYRGFGQPLLADPRAQVLYPPAWLNFVLPPWRSYSLLAMFHLWLGGLGAYRLARSLGGSRLAAFVSGSVFLASGPFASLAVTWHHQAGAAWIPWVVWGLWSARPALAAVTVALQVFAGSPEYTAAALCLGAAGGFVSGAGVRSFDARSALWGAGAGLALSAAQWLPTAGFALGSARSPTGSGGSLHPASLLELIAPVRLDRWALPDALLLEMFHGVQPWLLLRYVGACALALGLAAAARSPLLRRLLVLAAGATVLSSVGRGPLEALTWIPPFSTFRFPMKVLVLAALLLSLAGGLALDRLTEVRDRLRRLALIGLLPVVGASAFGLAIAAFHGIELSIATASDLPRMAARATALVVLFAAGVRRPVAALAVVMDVVTASAGLHAHAPHGLFRERPDGLQTIPADARVYVEDYSIASHAARPSVQIYGAARGPAEWSRAAASMRGVLRYLNPPTAGRWGLRGSYDADILDFYPRELKDLVATVRRSTDGVVHRRYLEAAAVDFAASLGDDSGTSGLRPLVTADIGLAQPMRIYAVPTPRKRDSVVAACRPSAGRSAEELLGDPDYDFTREVWLEECDGAPAGPRPPGEAIVEWEGASTRRIRARSPEGGWLVSLDAYAPGWTVTVNGAAVDVLRADGVFRAVRIPAGPSVVEFRYRPTSVFVGCAASAASALLCLFRLASRRRRTVVNPPLLG